MFMNMHWYWREESKNARYKIVCILTTIPQQGRHIQHSSTQKWNVNFAINKIHLVCYRTLNKTQNFKMNIYSVYIIVT